jgi:hypothetical protein
MSTQLLSQLVPPILALTNIELPKTRKRLSIAGQPLRGIRNPIYLQLKPYSKAYYLVAILQSS